MIFWIRRFFTLFYKEDGFKYEARDPKARYLNPEVSLNDIKRSNRQ